MHYSRDLCHNTANKIAFDWIVNMQIAKCIRLSCGERPQEYYSL